MERRLTAIIFVIFIMLFSIFNVAAGQTDDDVVTEGTVISQALAVSGDVNLDTDYTDGEVKKAYGHWSVNRVTENGTETLDETTEQLYQDSRGEVSFSKTFEREFSETGNYTYYIEIATAKSEYDVVNEEWNEYEMNSVSNSTYNFTVEEEDLLSVLSFL